LCFYFDTVANPGEKICKFCERSQPMENFYKFTRTYNGRTRSYYKGTCKNCFLYLQGINRSFNKIRKEKTDKQCKKCLEYFPRTKEFFSLTSTHGKTYLSPYCKHCKYLKQKEIKNKNIDI
jgi:hypothetical protein